MCLHDKLLALSFTKITQRNIFLKDFRKEARSYVSEAQMREEKTLFLFPFSFVHEGGGERAKPPT